MDQTAERLLAMTRKTVTASQHLIETARLRLDETDRLLEKHGLARERLLPTLAASQQTPSKTQQSTSQFPISAESNALQRRWLQKERA